jgi:hypothetical protein
MGGVRILSNCRSTPTAGEAGLVADVKGATADKLEHQYLARRG